jgi:hypothetical protein
MFAYHYKVSLAGQARPGTTHQRDLPNPRSIWLCYDLLRREGPGISQKRTLAMTRQNTEAPPEGKAAPGPSEYHTANETWAIDFFCIFNQQQVESCAC